MLCNFYPITNNATPMTLTTSYNDLPLMILVLRALLGCPSSQPSGQPSGQPFGQPSGQPSGQHTGQPSG